MNISVERNPWQEAKERFIDRCLITDGRGHNFYEWEDPSLLVSFGSTTTPRGPKR
ncbi:unnamed protein product, partial [Nesidiocoris tenuis]